MSCGCAQLGGRRRKGRRTRRKSNRSKRAGTIWQTIGTTLGMGPESNDNRACNSKLNETINIAKTGVACEDYYMGSPGSSNAKFIAPRGNCDNLLYTSPNDDHLKDYQKKVYFCRKGVNKTGQCKTLSPTRKERGTCNNKDMGDLISSLNVNTKAGQRAKAKEYLTAHKATGLALPMPPTIPLAPSVPTGGKRTRRGGNMVFSTDMGQALDRIANTTPVPHIMYGKKAKRTRRKRSKRGGWHGRVEGCGKSR
jgi:hypothetical protein